MVNSRRNLTPTTNVDHPMFSGSRKLIRAARTVKMFTLAGTIAALTVLASQSPSVNTVEAPTATPTLLEVHADECWTGSQPKLADEAGHVIVSLPNGEQRYSKRLVGPALDSLFGDIPADFDVIAFCL